MIDVNELRKGVTFEYDNQLYVVLDYSHNKTGRGNASIRTKLRNMRSGAIFEKTFQSGDRVQDIRLDHHQVQFLYKDGELYYFMDTETFEQPAINAKMLGDAVNYSVGKRLAHHFLDPHPGAPPYFFPIARFLAKNAAVQRSQATFRCHPDPPEAVAGPAAVAGPDAVAGPAAVGGPAGSPA